MSELELGFAVESVLKVPLDFCDFLIFSNFKGGWCNNVSNPVVEAWLPLPEPYKGGDKE